jgi:hypothetical protein
VHELNSFGSNIYSREEQNQAQDNITLGSRNQAGYISLSLVFQREIEGGREGVKGKVK